MSLFCGPGGLDYGFREAGFRTELAVDADDECVRTFELNHPESIVKKGDISALSIDDLHKMLGDKVRPIGVIGGPPCQSFSNSNVHQKASHPRNKLPRHYAQLPRKLNNRNPISFFIFENVPGLLNKKHIHRYENFRKLFGEAGFKIYEDTLDAKDYGVPQVRPRIFIIGFNKELHPNTEWVSPNKVNSNIKTKRCDLWFT